MIRFPFRAAPRLPLAGRDDAPLFSALIAAVIVYVAGCAGIGFLMVHDRLRAAEDLLAYRLTVQLPADVSPARLQTLLAVLRQTSGIRSVHLLTASETGRLLEPWLGSPVPAAELPVPRLIDAGVERDAAVDVALLKQRLAGVVPELRLDDHRPALAGLRDGARPLQAVLAIAIAVGLLLAGLWSGLATRAALRARRSDVELLHLLGAGDRDLARVYARRPLRDAAIGAALGSAAIVATLAALDGAGPVGPAAAAAAGAAIADWRVWAILAATATAAGVIAAFGAQATVLRHLARLP